MRVLHTRRAAALVVALIALSPGHGSSTAQQSELVRVEASRVSMGCVYAIVAYGARAEEVKGILEGALDEVDRIDRLASNYRPDSALSEVNRRAPHGAVHVEPELFEILSDATAYAAESGGAFDVTVGPLVKAWGLFDGDGRVPAPQELARVRRDVGYTHLVLDAAQQTVAFDRPRVEIDLGGIAKGYAVDRVVRLLSTRGVRAALVSAGGSTIYGLGAEPGTSAWDVELQDPLDRRKVALRLPLKDRALSVSGASERFFEAGGVRYSHIMDPQSGRPVQGVLTVAVLAESGTASDALGTALFVAGTVRGRRMLERHPGSEAIFLLPAAGQTWRSIHVTANRESAPASHVPARTVPLAH